MANNVRIQKTVYNKDQHGKVVDRSFLFFTPPVVEEGPTVEDFFALYEQLFYIIPSEGTTNSHEVLVQKSSELVNFEQQTQDIQPLLDEIASLRQQLLEARQEIIDIQVSVVS